MEACLGVEREVNKVLDRFTQLQSSNETLIADKEHLLKTAINELQLEGNFFRLIYIFKQYFILHCKFFIISEEKYRFKTYFFEKETFI